MNAQRLHRAKGPAVVASDHALPAAWTVADRTVLWDYRLGD
jgi:hypothetical protein